MRFFLSLTFFICIATNIFAQSVSPRIIQAKVWADSVFNTLTDDERIAQLMVVRLSSIDSKTRTVTFFDKQVEELIRKYNIGGICLFQGGPVKQANIVNYLQSISKTPLMMCMDAEWGVGMRILDSVQALPHQMMLGAVQDPAIIYQYGKVVGEQCRRLGINVNYAPVVDINNNPNNPVINDRSFGEDKYKVAAYGIQYMKGMQDIGVMACAKHFPGHGDVAVDSHLDLPVINKSMAQLDSLELYPFREMIKAGIGSVMIAHLYIPSIDSTHNRATSISKKNVTGLLRNQLGYDGLTFTDALEMQGVKKFFPNGASSAESIIAGNDMLCLPDNVAMGIQKIKEAIRDKRLSQDDINDHCKKVLQAKYLYGEGRFKAIDTDHLTADLNSNVPAMKKLVAENAITLLNKTDVSFFPLTPTANSGIAYVGIGLSSDNAFAKRMRTDYNADVFNYNYKQDVSRILSTVELIKTKYKKVIIGIHAYSRTPANNFGISSNAVELVSQLQQQTNTCIFVFGNPYAIKNFCNAKNLYACYEDDDFTQNAAIDILKGKLSAKGKLPVTVCDRYKYGSGIVNPLYTLPSVNPDEVGVDIVELHKIDSIATAAINNGATPGCVVLVAKDGKIAYNKAFGNYTYGTNEPVSTSTVYDLASVTKICATTLAVMKLYDEGKIDLNKNLGDYLPLTKGTDKESLLIRNILLHEAGLVPFIPFYKETIDPYGKPYLNCYSPQYSDSFNTNVAANLFLRNDWKDTMYKRIIESPLSATNRYVYSDNDFIFLGKIVETITGLPLNEYVKKEFYSPLGLATTGFKPKEYLPLNMIAPTEQEKEFRLQLIRGDVHDPGAAMFGGVAGHAGLFSNAYDIAVIMQMLLNGGTFNGKRYLQKKTIDLFTAYNSSVSRRGYGFDKPEKDNATRSEPYPCISSSPFTFGHTGFTGTCVWADPRFNLIYIFLSNRITPGSDNSKLSKMNIRSKIQEMIYQSLIQPASVK